MISKSVYDLFDNCRFQGDDLWFSRTNGYSWTGVDICADCDMSKGQVLVPLCMLQNEACIFKAIEEKQVLVHPVCIADEKTITEDSLSKIFTRWKRLSSNGTKSLVFRCECCGEIFYLGYGLILDKFFKPLMIASERYIESEDTCQCDVAHVSFFFSSLIWIYDSPLFRGLRSIAKSLLGEQMRKGDFQFGIPVEVVISDNTGSVTGRTEANELPDLEDSAWEYAKLITSTITSGIL